MVWYDLVDVFSLGRIYHFLRWDPEDIQCIEKHRCVEITEELYNREVHREERKSAISTRASPYYQDNSTPDSAHGHSCEEEYSDDCQRPFLHYIGHKSVMVNHVFQSESEDEIHRSGTRRTGYGELYKFAGRLKSEHRIEYSDKSPSYEREDHRVHPISIAESRTLAAQSHKQNLDVRNRTGCCEVHGNEPPMK